MMANVETAETEYPSVPATSTRVHTTNEATELEALQTIAAVLQDSNTTHRVRQEMRAAEVRERLAPLAEKAELVVKEMNDIVREYAGVVSALKAPHTEGWTAGMGRRAACYSHFDTFLARWTHTSTVTVAALRKVPERIEEAARLGETGEQSKAISLLTIDVQSHSEGPSRLRGILRYLTSYGTEVARKEQERLSNGE